ncbi:hypothetical protein [Bacillus cereus]|uniref:Uncharacterized protein n=1 Tax=Bacillus cereus TaxID=1396 RepID=A0A9X8IZH8_BACCE|nr:hypothetical protein [Bacillus cereus]RWQ73461.1 hypothetical protein DR116_0015490 [Bacillus cereus]
MPGYKNLIYTNAEELFHQNSAFAAYKDAIHITATNSLKAGMMKSNSGLNRWFTGPIISFAELMKYIGVDWSKGKTNLKQYTLLSKELRRFNEESLSLNADLFAAIDKNQELLLKTIRLLSESGYTSATVRNMLKTTTEQERVFLELWQAVELNPSYSNIHVWFESLSKSPKREFRATLKKLFEDIIENDQKRVNANIPYGHSVHDIVHMRIRQGKKSRLVLHGFYFLVPIQKRLFDLLSEKFDIIHVVNYQPNYKHGFQTIEQFLNIQQLGFKHAMPYPYTVNYHAKEFLCAINGSFTASKMVTDEQDIRKINYFEFNTLQQFRRYTQNNDERFVSPRTMEVRDFLSPIEQATYKKLSEHPLGAFLVNIHLINKRKFNVKTAQYNDIENITHTLLREIFNSGYLFVKGINAQTAMRTLDFLQEITKEFTTFNEWTTCIDTLIATKQQAEDQFAHLNSYDNDEHRLYSFYHEVIGYFYSSEEELIFVKEGIFKIEQLFNLLFDGTEINISQYVEMLEAHVTKDIVPSLSENLDKEIAKNILLALEELKDDTLDRLDRKDLMRGLRYFLAQGADSEDEYEAELYSNVEPGTTETINSLLNSDGLQFDDNRVIHFSLMDNVAFPTSQPLNIWPLSRDSFDLLCQNNLYLHQLQIRKELEVEIACYQFYLIMSNAVKLNFSIVRRLNERKHLKRCFYLNFLTLIKGSQQQVNRLIQKEKTPTYIKETIGFNERQYEMLPAQVFNRCPKRFVYSLLIDRRPTFYEGFHEPFLFQQLIGYDQVHSKKQNEQDMFEQYRSWFPHWSETKKNVYQTAAIEYATKNPDKINQQFTWINGWKYFNIRMRLNLFGSASERELMNRREYNVNDVLFTRPGDNCKYCSFQFVCEESQLHMP